MRILVIDLCGTHVKLLVTRHKKRMKIPTSPNMTAVRWWWWSELPRSSGNIMPSRLAILGLWSRAIPSWNRAILGVTGLGLTPKRCLRGRQVR